MKRFFAVLFALGAMLVVAPSAHAALSITNATNECSQRMYADAYAGMGGTLTWHGPTDYIRYSSTDVAVRGRFMNNIRATRWYNCRVTGNDSGAYVAETFFMGWAAPNYNIFVDQVPNWQYHLHPFVDPASGIAW